MRILLLGEYSALYKNLKEGLEILGHQVVTASTGDGYKEIEKDIDLGSPYYGVLGKLHRALKPILIMNKLTGYDVVQVINPFMFYGGKFPALKLFEYITKHNKKSFLSAAGDDSFVWQYGVKRMRYSPHEESLKYDLKRKNYFMQKKSALEFNKKIIDMCNGVIPIAYEYEISYSDEPKRLITIPMPINTKRIEYKENLVKGKLIIFHGLNRYGFKGTRHVVKAFEVLGKKYPNDLELIMDGKMSLRDYLGLMQRTNVIIDQLYSYSLGMNGNYALAMGKVVMGGAEPESLKSLGVDSSPAINVLPTTESIITEVEKLLEKKNEIPQIGYESRKFAENVHECSAVAKQYTKIWNDN